MDVESLKADLRKEWKKGGFFLELRHGNFDEQLYARALATLKKIDFEDRDLIEREIVSAIWDLPLFFKSHIRICEERGADSRALKNAFFELVALLMEKVHGKTKSV